jgi:uncharacterized protein (UPF0332 family)
MNSYLPEDYARHRIKKAFETIQEVETHIENKFWNTAINRMYYACFYAVGAILIKNQVNPSSHSGVRQKFGQLFVKTGIIEKTLAKHYADLFEKRHKGDYNDFFDFDEETVIRLFPKSKEFVEEIAKLIE